MKRIVGVLLAITLLGASPLKEPAPSGGNTQTEQKTNANQKAQDTNTNARGTESSPLVVQIAQPKNHEAIATKAQDEARWYALPDWWVAGFTAALFVATAGLWLFTGLLWSSTRTLVGDEQRNNKRELRAYLSVEPLGINQLIRSDYALGQVAVRNVGKMPAQNVTVVVKMIEKADRTFNPSDPGTADPSNRTIQPGSEMRQGSKDQLLVQQICQPGKFIFVWGRVEYDDGFGEVRRFTNFCHRYSAASYDRNVAWTIQPTEIRPIITSDKARYHPEGNNAD